MDGSRSLNRSRMDGRSTDATARLVDFPVRDDVASTKPRRGRGGDSIQARTENARNSRRVADGIHDAVGDTPLVRLRRFLDPGALVPGSHRPMEGASRRAPEAPSAPSVQLYAKLESINPGGSAKDRPALEMLRSALDEGLVDDRTTIIESSSGNMGIGLAQMCAAAGMRFICVVDPRAQPTNVAMIRALGAQVVCVEEPDEHTGDFLVARLQRVEELLRTIPNSYWPNQYENPNNPASHAFGTMREIDEALEGQYDYVFVATSSTGTASGCQDYLRENGRDAAVIAVDATSSVLFGGPGGPRHIPGMGAGIEPELARGRSFLDVLRVDDLACVVGCRRLALTEGILVGGSAGGVLEAIRRKVSLLPRKARCVSILADGGARYLDTIFDDEWVRDTLGCSPEELDRLVREPQAQRGTLESRTVTADSVAAAGKVTYASGGAK